MLLNCVKRKNGWIMKKIEAIIKPFKLDEVKDELNNIGVLGMTVQRSKAMEDKKVTLNFIVARIRCRFSKIKIELVIDDNLGDESVEAIKSKAHTGRIGDGKICHMLMK